MASEKKKLSNRKYTEIHRQEINARHKLEYAANKEEKLARQRAWRAANPERMAAYSIKYHTANRAKEAERQRDRVKAKREAAATRPRPEVCEICGGNGAKALGWDHNHKTGAFRGWLCYGCNSVLGFVNDDAGRLRALATYIEKGGPEE